MKTVRFKNILRVLMKWQKAMLPPGVTREEQIILDLLEANIDAI